MASSGSGIFDWTLLEETETVSSFTLDASEADARKKELCLVEEAVIENTGRVDDALAGTILPSDDSETITAGDFVKRELPTPEEPQEKFAEMDEAMSALHDPSGWHSRPWC